MPFELLPQSIVLNTTFKNPEIIKIDPSTISCLKVYQNMDKKLIDLFAQQNNMSFNPKEVDRFIDEHFYRLSGVVADLDSAYTHQVPSLPWEILKKICLHLKLSDVEHSMQCADDNTTPVLGEYTTE